MVEVEVLDLCAALFGCGILEKVLGCLLEIGLFGVKGGLGDVGVPWLGGGVWG